MPTPAPGSRTYRTLWPGRARRAMKRATSSGVKNCPSSRRPSAFFSLRKRAPSRTAYSDGLSLARGRGRPRKIAAVLIPIRFYRDVCPQGCSRRQRPSAERRGRRRRSLGGQDHGGAIAEHLGDALHDLRRVVAHADDRVRADVAGVAEHHVEGLGPGPLAELGEERDVPPDERLERAPDRAEDRARAHGDAAHDPEVPGHPVAVERERGRRHGMRHEVILLQFQRESSPGRRNGARKSSRFWTPAMYASAQSYRSSRRSITRTR